MGEDTVTQEEFLAKFEVLMAYVKKIEGDNETERGEIWAKMEEALNKAYEKVTAQGIEEVRANFASLREKIESRISQIKNGIDGRDGINGKDGVDGRDGLDGHDGADGINGLNGKDADETAIVSKIEKDLPSLAYPIRDALELLTGEERLDAKSIKNLPEAPQEIVRTAGGTRGVNLYVDNAKKGLVNTINLKAGSNLSLSHAPANGLNTVTINGTATGNVVGPTSSVDKSIVRYSGTTGKLIQGYTSNAPTVSDTGAVTMAVDAGTSISSPLLTLTGYNSTSTAKSATLGQLWDAANSITKFRLQSASASGYLDLFDNGSWTLSSGTNLLSIIGELTNPNTDLVLRPTNGGVSVIVKGISTQSVPAFIVRSAATQNTSLQEWQNSSSVALVTIDKNGNLGVGATPTAVLHLKAGTATANTAPLKMNSGTKLTTPEVGAVEYDANNFYYTKNTAIRESIPGTLFTQTADATVTNTVTETSIIGSGVGTLTLPANFFVAGKTIRVTMSGVYSTVAVTGDTVTIKVKYGTTVLASKATTALVTGGTNLFWASEVLITCRTAGASGAVQVSGGVIYQIAGSATVEDELNNGASTTTLDTTASGLFDVTITHSAQSASNTVKSLVGTFEVIN